jgi:hypothetical protein
VARVESGAKAVKSPSFANVLLVAAGSDPYELLEQGVTTAAALSGGLPGRITHPAPRCPCLLPRACLHWCACLFISSMGCEGSGGQPVLSPLVFHSCLAAGNAKHRSRKEVPAAADVFGWCTWDAFYSRVSAAGIEAGLRSLADGGVPPKLVIIDDGWQRTDVDERYRAEGAKELAGGCLAAACCSGGSHCTQALSDCPSVPQIIPPPPTHPPLFLPLTHLCAPPA